VDEKDNLPEKGHQGCGGTDITEGLGESSKATETGKRQVISTNPLPGAARLLLRLP